MLGCLALVNQMINHQCRTAAVCYGHNYIHLGWFKENARQKHRRRTRKTETHTHLNTEKEALTPHLYVTAYLH